MSLQDPSTGEMLSSYDPVFSGPYNLVIFAPADTYFRGFIISVFAGAAPASFDNDFMMGSVSVIGNDPNVQPMGDNNPDDGSCFGEECCGCMEERGECKMSPELAGGLKRKIPYLPPPFLAFCFQA